VDLNREIRVVHRGGDDLEVLAQDLLAAPLEPALLERAHDLARLRAVSTALTQVGGRERTIARR
jgi:hypothetical protein